MAFVFMILLWFSYDCSCAPSSITICRREPLWCIHTLVPRYFDYRMYPASHFEKSPQKSAPPVLLREIDLNQIQHTTKLSHHCRHPAVFSDRSQAQVGIRENLGLITSDNHRKPRLLLARGIFALFVYVNFSFFPNKSPP